MTDQEVARLLWYWAIWLNDESNAAFCACDMDQLEEIRVAGLEKYEEWRKVRETISTAYPWLKEKP